MKKIVILKDIPEYEQAIKKIAPEWEIVFTKDKASSKQSLVGAEVVLGWSDLVAKELENGDASLRWVQLFTAGVDNLPLGLLEQNSVVLTNARGVHSRQIAETFFASLLGIVRGVPQWVGAQQKSKWSMREMRSESFGEICGKTLGILGVGTIGLEIAKISRAFSMYNLGLRRSNKAAPYIDQMYTMSELKQMLPLCDYIVNILPLTPETNGMINAEVFASMKTGAGYFSFGRGETTVTGDLVSALESGKLSCAGLDVIDPEPLPASHPLWQMKNVLISPHMSGYSPYTLPRVMDIFLKNLADYVDGEPLTAGKINLELGY